MKQVQTADPKELRTPSRPRLESGALYPTKIDYGYDGSEQNSVLAAHGEFGSLGAESSASFNRPIVVAKVAIIFFVLIVNFLYTRRVKTVKEPVACLQDSGYEWTAELNAELNRNPALLKTFQITSSGLVDLADLSSIVAFWLQSDNARSGSQLGVFYATRAFLQGNFMFAFPEGGIWDYPGIPSLTVPYGLTSDFYFSGHCGFVTLVVLEHLKLGNKKLAILLSFIIPYLALVLIATRIHYTIDIPIGVLFAWYVHTMLHNHLQQFQYLIRATLNRYCLQKIRFFAEV
jgi:PAP2 superfamily C-terminal